MVLHTTAKLFCGVPIKRLILYKRGTGQFTQPLYVARAVSGRWKSTDSSSTGKELDVARKSPYEGLSMGEKVKEVSKDSMYLGISVVAIGVFGAMVYYIGSELFPGQSVNSVYGKALKACKDNSEVQIVLGKPIKGYGETDRRGRKKHVSHTEFLKDGKQHMRMKFHLQGPDKKATVQLEVVKNDSGKYEYRYLFAQIDEFPYQTIVVEDNR